MNSSTLPLEFELTVLKIAAQTYPNTRHSLTPDISKNCICIEFKGFFTIKFKPENRPYSNPIHDFYRNPNADFLIMYFPNGEHLIVSGWWRGAILSLHYDASALHWQTDDGDEITRPVPDGDRFEHIAAELHPILQKYFKL